MVFRKRSREHLTVMCALTRVAKDLTAARWHSVSNVTRVSLARGGLDVLGEKTIQLVGEKLALTQTESSRTPGVHTAAT
jgi:hypothetical protein